MIFYLVMQKLLNGMLHYATKINFYAIFTLRTQ